MATSDEHCPAGVQQCALTGNDNLICEDDMKKSTFLAVTLCTLALAPAAFAADKKTCEGRAPACAVCKNGIWDQSGCKATPAPAKKEKADEKKK